MADEAAMAEDSDLKAANKAINDDEKADREESTPIQSLAHTKDDEETKKSVNPQKLATIMSKKEELIAAKEKI